MILSDNPRHAVIQIRARPFRIATRSAARQPQQNKHPMNKRNLSLAANSPSNKLRRKLLCVLGSICVASSPTVRAVDPLPDGGHPNYNTAEGDGALNYLNTSSGNNNTAVGSNALFSNVYGSANAAVGSGALADNTADRNAAVGFQSLITNTTGLANTAIGNNALLSNNTGILS